MRTQRKINYMNSILQSKSAVFAILLVMCSFRTTRAQQWERVSGSESPGIRILDERPMCWFSISRYSSQYFIKSQSSVTVIVIVSNIKYNIVNQVIEYSETITGNGSQSPVTTSFSNIKYNSLGQVIEYYANVTGTEYPIETYVYDGTYNAHGQVTDFKELRHYTISGNTYYIEISGVSYNGFGQVMNGYPVNITANSAIEIPGALVKGQ